MSDVKERLKSIELIARLPLRLAADLIADAVIVDGADGDRVEFRAVDYFVLLSGDALLVKRADGAALASWRCDASSKPALVYAVPPQCAIQLTSPSQFVVLDGEKIDAALDTEQEPPPTIEPPSEMKQRVDWLRQTPVFAQLSLFETAAVAAALQPFEAGEGWEIVRQGSPGNYFYIIETGGAEVWRAGPLTGGKLEKVASLGPGDSFGEEALLREAGRNATVRMVEQGRLLRLDHAQFDELLRDGLLNQIEPGEAKIEIETGKCGVIDCRHDIEHELARIPGAQLLPLHDIRERAAELDKSRRYVVYCRSGRRSRAAAFLLQRMGYDAKAIRGGLANWPFEVVGSFNG